jgi:hypothetical protein
MKKVINHALYNTETAKLLGVWANGGTWRDFEHMEEQLFRTKSGKYFIFGEGGPMTQYAKSEGNNSWTGGRNIEPMSPAAAADWAQEHLTADEFAEIFGEPDEAGDDREALNLNVPANVKARLEQMRSETGKSISQIVVDLVAAL